MWWILACVDPEDSATKPLPDSGTLPDTAETGETGETTTDVGDFTVCGLRVAITPALSVTGFTDLQFPDRTPRDVAWVGDIALSVDAHGLSTWDAAFTALDPALPLPTPLSLAVTDGAVFVRGGDGITVLTPDTWTPYAWWTIEQEGTVGAELIGENAGRLVIWTSAGISIVDVTDLDAPRELGCAADAPDQTWTEHLDGDWLVTGTSSGARLYNVAGDTPVLVDTLPLAEEGAAVLWGTRLLTWTDYRTVVLYELGSGAPVEVARVEDETDVQASLWDPHVAAGFAFHGGLDGGMALDLLADDLTVVAVDDLDPERACVVAVGEVEVSPMWFPETRYLPGEAPRGCPEGEDGGEFPHLGGRDGDRVFMSGDGWRVVDVTTAEVTPIRDDGGAAWFLDAGYLFLQTEGSDWGIPLVSTFTRTDADGVDLDSFESPGPTVAAAGADHAVWAIVEAAPRTYGDPAPAPSTNLLWRIDGAGTHTEVALPSGAAPIDVIAGDGEVWVYDAAGLVYRVDAGGVATTCDLGSAGSGPRVASALGAFDVDAAGDVRRVSGDCTVTALGAVEGTLAGADDAWLYVAAEVGPGPAYPTVPMLQALDPGSLLEVGHLPTTRTPIVSPGARLLVADTGYLFADRP